MQEQLEDPSFPDMGPSSNQNAFVNFTNLLGPVSRIRRMGCHLKKSPEDVEAGKETKKKEDDSGQKFAMSKMKNSPENEGDSQEDVETQRAERAEFVRMMMLSLVQEVSSQLLNKTHCNLSGWKIKELETNNSWKIIDLSHNSIEFVDSPDVLKKQIHLETLRLSFNPAFNEQGNKQIFAHAILKVFECKACGFTEIQSEHFTGLVNLMELYLTSNKINRINEKAFLSCGNLKLLDLSDNRLTVLPSNLFTELRGFEALFLSNNDIELPKNRAFLRSESLKQLKIDSCKIQLVHPETFTELRSLEILNLNLNLIELLPGNSFKQNSKLKSLFIESNRLRFFPITILDFSPQIDELCIDNNSFVDSQDFTKLVKIYDEKPLRTQNCNSDMEFFIENLFANVNNTSNEDSNEIEVFDVQKSKVADLKFSNQGVSDFFIGSYITFILIMQAITFILLSIYLIKISKYEKLDGEVNYANTILNDDEIYRVYKPNE